MTASKGIQLHSCLRLPCEQQGEGAQAPVSREGGKDFEEFISKTKPLNMCWETEEGGYGGKSEFTSADRFGSLHDSQGRQRSAAEEPRRSVGALARQRVAMATGTRQARC